VEGHCLEVLLAAFLVEAFLVEAFLVVVVDSKVELLVEDKLLVDRPAVVERNLVAVERNLVVVDHTLEEVEHNLVLGNPLEAFEPARLLLEEWPSEVVP